MSNTTQCVADNARVIYIRYQEERVMPNSLLKRHGQRDLATRLRDARRHKGRSELGSRARLAQSQRSKIEHAEVDPQISTMLELARSLDLDLRLVPRGALGAVEAAVKDAALREQTGRRVSPDQIDFGV